MGLMPSSSLTPEPALAFDFGSNWQDYSLRKLDAARLQIAQESLTSLLDLPSLEGRRFLDVGCGSGIFTYGAASLGAESALGLDVNPLCIQVSEANSASQPLPKPPRFIQASALDPAALAPLGQFDIVYAWGSLHHSGAMYEAITNVARLVAPNGLYVLAIYNRHVTSRAWRFIKWLYNRAPRPLQKGMIGLFGALIYVAKALVTRRNPLEKERGMDFWVDVVDWVGGYPYEYASRAEMEAFMQSLGFRLQKYLPPTTPTGCNEFVFVRHADPLA